MPLNIDLNIPCNNLDIDLNIPCNNLDIDLNIPCNDPFSLSDFNGDKENRALSTGLENSSSSIKVLLPSDLVNECFSNEAENGFRNESEAVPSDDAFDNYDDLLLEEDSMFTASEERTQPSKKTRTFLNNEQRKIVSQLLINSSSNGVLDRGTIKSVASSFSVSKDAIYRIWKQLKQTGDACHKKRNCGPKGIEIDIQKIRDVSLPKRSTLRGLAGALGISPTPILKCLKEGVLRRHSNELKPHLKDDNMKARLRFCLSMIEESTIPHDPMFKSMHNVVHIDEKWFFLSKKRTNYYILADESEPYRTCKNKNFVGKVMFLVAVARPRFDHEGKNTFSGKIGVFPLVDKVPAKRSSANRPAGTLETKPIASITKEVSRRFLIDKVLPAIKEKWPREVERETIYIQQDNAPCHVPIDDEEYCRAASEGGFDIRLCCQPPNSPDLNVLDLGFFSAIQSLQQKEVTNSVDELIQAVQKCYDDFSSNDSNKIFVTLQSCMIEIMKVKGSNCYKIPHMKKEAMLKGGGLPTQLKCDPELAREFALKEHASVFEFSNTFFFFIPASMLQLVGLKVIPRILKFHPVLEAFQKHAATTKYHQKNHAWLSPHKLQF